MTKQRITFILTMCVLTCTLKAANYFNHRFAEEVTESVQTALVSLEEENTNKNMSEEVADKLIQLVHKKGYSRSRPDLVRGVWNLLLKTHSETQLNSIEYHETLYATLRSDGICFKKNFFHCNDERRSSYRTLDGACNNVQNPGWGMSFRPQSRFLSAEYDDGVSLPRQRTQDGKGTLPNPRTVSNVVHANLVNSISVERIASLHAFQWGQFLDHDLIATPLFTGANDAPLQCCENKETEELHKTMCSPIHVPKGDAFFRDGTCMNVQRSAPALNLDCTVMTGQRQQENQVTSYIDASQIYGSTMAELFKLRNKKSPEYMAVSEGGNLPFSDDSSECILTDTKEKCFLAGDERVNIVPSLASYQALFVRQHNRIVDLLKNQGWTNPDLLFHEARKILSAQIQHITYNEFLRWLLDDRTYSGLSLQPLGPGQWFTQYDNRITTDIANDFGIAYRMGHSWISNGIRLSTERGESTNSSDPDFKDLDQAFFNPHMLFMRGRTGATRLLKSMTKDRCPLTDRIIEDSVRNKLFLASGDSFDLAAINIIRAREHGIPPYWRYRVNLCREIVPNPDDWQSLAWHTGDVIDLLKKVYRSPKDIDLWTGLVTENRHTQVMGPTLNCILGEQFMFLKFGDRYWYERPEPEGFSVEKLDAIKRATTLASLICANLNDPNFRIPQNAIFVESNRNPSVPCAAMPQLDLRAWRIKK